MKTGQIVRDDPTMPIDVRWPLVPGATALNDTVEGFARERERAFLRDALPSSTAPPELNLGWLVPLAAGRVVGVELDQYEFYGADGADSTVTYYSDVTAGQVWRGRDLLAPDGLAAAVRDIAAALQRDGRTVLPELLNDPEQVAAAVDAMYFSPDGSVRFTLPEGALGPMSDGMSSVSVPEAVAAPWLSSAGHIVQAAARTAAPYVFSTAPTTSEPSSPPTSIPPTSNPTTSTPSTTSSPTQPPTGGTVNCAKLQCVALTFDDGPGPSTGTLLDTLAAAHVHATFFVIGRNVQALPALVTREAAEGHVVGNHTWSHRDLSRLGASDQRSEVSRTAEALAALGRRPRRLAGPRRRDRRGTGAGEHAPGVDRLASRRPPLDRRGRPRDRRRAEGQGLHLRHGPAAHRHDDGGHRVLQPDLTPLNAPGGYPVISGAASRAASAEASSGMVWLIRSATTR
jgi:hypothetical protein